MDWRLHVGNERQPPVSSQTRYAIKMCGHFLTAHILKTPISICVNPLISKIGILFIWLLIILFNLYLSDMSIVTVPMAVSSQTHSASAAEQ